VKDRYIQLFLYNQLHLGIFFPAFILESSPHLILLILESSLRTKVVGLGWTRDEGGMGWTRDMSMVAVEGRRACESVILLLVEILHKVYDLSRSCNC
jgi:hypothetical protein